MHSSEIHIAIRRNLSTDWFTGSNENAQLAPSETIAPRECGWKDGDSGDSAGVKPCLIKTKIRLDSDRPSHGRPFRSIRLLAITFMPLSTRRLENEKARLSPRPSQR